MKETCTILRLNDSEYEIFAHMNWFNSFTAHGLSTLKVTIKEWTRVLVSNDKGFNF